MFSETNFDFNFDVTWIKYLFMISRMEFKTAIHAPFMKNEELTDSFFSLYRSYYS